MGFSNVQHIIRKIAYSHGLAILRNVMDKSISSMPFCKLRVGSTSVTDKRTTNVQDLFTLSGKKYFISAGFYLFALKSSKASFKVFKERISDSQTFVYLKAHHSLKSTRQKKGGQHRKKAPYFEVWSGPPPRINLYKGLSDHLKNSSEPILFKHQFALINYNFFFENQLVHLVYDRSLQKYFLLI